MGDIVTSGTNLSNINRQPTQKVHLEHVRRKKALVRGAPTPAGRPGPLCELALDVHQLLKHLIGRRQSPGVRCETPLRHDEVSELSGQVDVGHLQSPTLD